MQWQKWGTLLDLFEKSEYITEMLLDIDTRAKAVLIQDFIQYETNSLIQKYG